MVNKHNFKNTYNTLKKMTIITIIICVVIMCLVPLVIFLKSKYTITKKEEVEHTQEIKEVKDIF